MTPAIDYCHKHGRLMEWRIGEGYFCIICDTEATKEEVKLDEASKQKEE